MPTAGAALPHCGVFPNCVNSESAYQDRNIDPIKASRSQWQHLKERLSQHKDWILVLESGEYLHYEATTPLMRFTDDVLLRYDHDNTLIHVRSSSRLGIGDMGANRTRVEWLRQLTEAGR